MKPGSHELSNEEFWAQHDELMRQSRLRIAQMTPEERAALQKAADNLGRKMQSGFDPTYKNVTPPPTPKAKGRRRPARAVVAGHPQMPEQKPAKSQV
ncbi:MAG: hypothetical protein ABSE73_26950 [Planctomycetota bacterium]